MVNPSVAQQWGRVRRGRNWGTFETEEADLTGEVDTLSILVKRRKREGGGVLGGENGGAKTG